MIDIKKKPNNPQPAEDLNKAKVDAEVLKAELEALRKEKEELRKEKDEIQKQYNIEVDKKNKQNTKEDVKKAKEENKQMKEDEKKTGEKVANMAAMLKALQVAGVLPSQTNEKNISTAEQLIKSKARLIETRAAYRKEPKTPILWTKALETLSPGGTTLSINFHTMHFGLNHLDVAEVKKEFQKWTKNNPNATQDQKNTEIKQIATRLRGMTFVPNSIVGRVEYDLNGRVSNPKDTKDYSIKTYDPFQKAQEKWIKKVDEMTEKDEQNKLDVSVLMS